MRKLFLLIPLLLFGACDSDPEVTEGYVVQKNFEPAHWEGGWVEVCENDWFDTDEDGQIINDDCDTEWEAHHTHVSDRWKIRLEDCQFNDKNERKCYRSWLTVDEDTFRSYRVGAHYPNPA